MKGGAHEYTSVLRVRSGKGPMSSHVHSSHMHRRSPQQYQYYRSIVENNGGTMTPDGPTVLGVRGETIAGKVHDTTSSKVYDDTIIVLGNDGQSVDAFRCVTHPAQKSSVLSPGGNVGEIRPGPFIAIPNGIYHNVPSYHLLNADGSDGLPCWRDYNHDGVMEPSEKQRSEAQHDTATAILIHASGNASVPTSIGCQVLSPPDQRRFVKAVGGDDAHFNYLLVDVHDVSGGVQPPA